MLLALLSWLIVPRITHAFAVKRDIENRRIAEAIAKEWRKRDFRSTIVSIRDEILSKKDGELVATHKESLPRFRELCAKIVADISDTAAFQRTGDDYISLAIERRGEKPRPKPSQDEDGNYSPGNILKQETPRSYNREEIKNLLEKIVSYAN
jgi:hypothetical protein